MDEALTLWALSTAAPINCAALQALAGWLMLAKEECPGRTMQNPDRSFMFFASGAAGSSRQQLGLAGGLAPGRQTLMGGFRAGNGAAQ